MDANERKDFGYAISDVRQALQLLERACGLLEQASATDAERDRAALIRDDTSVLLRRLQRAVEG